MKNTLIVNLFGAPCSGKSTSAAYIFAQLKMLGVDCEYVSEFAKDKVWEENKKIFNNQFYITGKQSWKIARVNSQVDVIINDSPILIGAVYTDRKYLKLAIIEEFLSYGDCNLNYVLNRNSDYNPNGRNQTEAEAQEIDRKIKEILSQNEIPYMEIQSSQEGCNEIIQLILKILEYLKLNQHEE